MQFVKKWKCGVRMLGARRKDCGRDFRKNYMVYITCKDQVEFSVYTLYICVSILLKRLCYVQSQLSVSRAMFIYIHSTVHYIHANASSILKATNYKHNSSIIITVTCIYTIMVYMVANKF